MKGHMEKDGFHPHTQYKGVRKSRDQKEKTKGVIRLARSSKLSEKQAKNFWNRLTPRSKFDVLTLELDLFLGNIPEHNEGKSFFDRSFDELPIKYQNLVRSKTLKQLKRFTGLKGTPVQAFSPLSVKVERKAREILTIQEQRDNFGFEFREKGGDELTEEINRKWENVIVKSTMHKLSKGFAITALDDLIRNFRAFFDDTNWELIAKEKGGVGIVNEIRSIKKSSLLFAEERLKDRFGFGEPDPRPTDKAGKIVQQLFEPFEKMRDEQFGQIKEREADFLMAKKIIADATDEIQDESQKQLIRGLKL